jgi:hypothetical protein
MKVKCVECETDFVLSDQEIDFYVQKFGEGATPKRCKGCRRLRRAARGEQGQASRQVEAHQP